jgi:hypothetical protein
LQLREAVRCTMSSGTPIALTFFRARPGLVGWGFLHFTWRHLAAD